MTLERLERTLVVQMTGSVPPGILTNATYFFCKFQAGSDNLWTLIEGQIKRQATNMNADQISRVTLALVMNHRPIPDGLTSVLFKQILSKLNEASSDDFFIMFLALDRGLGVKFDESQIPNIIDIIIWGFYVTAGLNIRKYDLQQIALISMFFSREDVTQHVPDVFWTLTLEPALEDRLDRFIKFKDQTDRGKFLSNFIKACASFGKRQIETPLFKSKVEHVVHEMVDDLDCQTTENLLIFLQNAGEIQNGPLVKKLVEHIEENEWVLEGQIENDVVMILVNLLRQHASYFRPERLWD